MEVYNFHNKFLKVILSIVFFIVLDSLYFCEQEKGKIEPVSSGEKAVPLGKLVALGNGCFHVFIDAGSNRGVHGRFLFEPEKYKNSAFVKKFQELFGGNRTLQNICVFAFEPNPIHNESQRKTQAAYELMGWRYKYLPLAVGTFNGTMNFYRNSDLSGATAEQVGFGSKRRGKPDKDQEIVVDIVDLSLWLVQNIFSRDIPERNMFNLGPPLVVMKMDIEGSEYSVLDHLIMCGTHKKLDHIFGEWHNSKGLPFTFRGRSIVNVTESTKISLELTLRLSANGGPGFVIFDDEQYLHDGMEYPIPL